MYNHYIVMSSAFTLGTRIALDYIIEKDSDIEKVKSDMKFIQENAKNDKEFFSIILAILIGRICLEVPIRIMDFHRTLYSLYILLLRVLSIVLAAVCVRKNKTIVFVLSTTIGVLMNSIGHEIWRYSLQE